MSDRSAAVLGVRGSDGEHGADMCHPTSVPIGLGGMGVHDDILWTGYGSRRLVDQLKFWRL
jgi:hypothetical protein